MFIEEERRSKEKIPALEIYTDGSLKKLGPHITCGGWAFLAIREHKLFYEGSGYEANTTNQRMELTAIAEGLKYATEIRRPNEKVIFYSDSAYAINCYEQEWYLKWQDNGWKNSKKESVANQDLWLEIIPYFNSQKYPDNVIINILIIFGTLLKKFRDMRKYFGTKNVTLSPKIKLNI